VLRCTLSAGWAAFRQGQGVDDLLREADAGLYRSKQSGKDRVSRAGDTPREHR
jgi:PleD family two-component response regulator